MCNSYKGFFICVTSIKVLGHSRLYAFTGSEIQWKSGNPFSQRFSSTKLQESKQILINISVYHTKLYGENP